MRLRLRGSNVISRLCCEWVAYEHEVAKLLRGGVAIAAINLFILTEVVATFRKVRSGEPYEEQSPDAALARLGVMGRVFRPALRMVERSWQMYFVGFLFGLGFDTATEVGLLGISATTATQGLAIWSILLFPALFTAGMCLVDTADGILMLGAYRWACVHPIRKLYYNMTITGVSVLIAVVIGGLEVLEMIVDSFDLHGRLCDRIRFVGDHSGAIGTLIILVFVASWLVSTLAYRLMGYAALEAERALASTLCDST